MIDNTGNFFQNQLIRTLMKAPDERSDKEIDVLYQLCLSKQKPGDEGFFAKFLREEGQAKLRQLLRLSYYEFVPKDHLVFEYKASGAEFFIILEGLVHYYGPNSADDEAIKKEMQRISKEKEEPIAGPARVKSSYEGVPPTKPCLNSEIKRTASGVHVYYNSRSSCSPRCPHEEGRVFWTSWRQFRRSCSQRQQIWPAKKNVCSRGS